jgi:tRNA threonylcarbamoyladenosine biosynthesis protein TsaB
MYLIAVETSNDACSVALSTPQGIFERYREAPRQHAELLLPMLDEVLQQAGVSKQQLDGIAFGRGPGGFIGVRIAASVTQGIALALQIPVVPVSSLAAMAQSCRADAKYLIVANDARMNEAYCAIYQSDGNGNSDACVQAQLADCLLPPHELDLSNYELEQCLAIGSAWQAFPDSLSARYPSLAVRHGVYPHARHVLSLGLQQWQRGEKYSAEQAQPVYLRDSVVQTKPAR